jgi:hypothetical protein
VTISDDFTYLNPHFEARRQVSGDERAQGVHSPPRFLLIAAPSSFVACAQELASRGRGRQERPTMRARGAVPRGLWVGRAE